MSTESWGSTSSRSTATIARRRSSSWRTASGTLNQTRLRAVAAGFGWNEDNWVGQTIIVYRGSAPFQGKIVDAVAVEAVVPNRLASEPKKAIEGGLKSVRRGAALNDDPPAPDPDDPGADPDDQIPF